MSKAAAFTLIELSIVILVIAIISGSILIGARISDDAKIRSFSNEISMLESGIRNFKDIYRYVPGDFPKASNFFSDATSADDGNGNSVLDTNAQSQAEISRIANHLAYSELVTNLEKSTSARFKSKIFTLGVYEFQKPCSSTDGLYNDADFEDTAIFYNSAGGVTWTPAISTIQAYNTDLKLDDGKAATGKIRAFVDSDDEDTYSCVSSATDCSSANSDTDYQKTNRNLGCALALGLNPILKN